MIYFYIFSLKIKTTQLTTITKVRKYSSTYDDWLLLSVFRSYSSSSKPCLNENKGKTTLEVIIYCLLFSTKLRVNKSNSTNLCKPSLTVYTGDQNSLVKRLKENPCQTLKINRR